MRVSETLSETILLSRETRSLRPESFVLEKKDLKTEGKWMTKKEGERGSTPLYNGAEKRNLDRYSFKRLDETD